MLTENGFTAKPHYNGVVDVQAMKRAAAPENSRSNNKRKLDNIVIREIKPLFGFSLAEAVNFLNAEFKNSDPNRVGVRIEVNEFIDTYVESTPAPVLSQISNSGAGVQNPNGGMGFATNQTFNFTQPPKNGWRKRANENAVVNNVNGAPQIDPVTGLPVAGQGGLGAANGPVDGPLGPLLPAFNADDVKIIGLKEPMRNMTARQILDAVALSLDTPVQYFIFDSGVVFADKNNDERGMHTRTGMRLKPNFLLQGLEKITTLPASGNAQNGGGSSRPAAGGGIGAGMPPGKSGASPAGPKNKMQINR